MSKDFYGWNKQKIKLNNKNTQSLYFNPREIWWCAVGLNIGTEINGKHKLYERPVLIIKKISRHQFIGLPLTTKMARIQDPFAIKLSIDSFALFSQIRLFSTKRLLRKLSKISVKEYKLIKLYLQKHI